jgi:hypothetical protein
VRQADRDTQLVGIVGEDLLGGRRVPVEALDQAAVDCLR